MEMAHRSLQGCHSTEPVLARTDGIRHGKDGFLSFLGFACDMEGKQGTSTKENMLQPCKYLALGGNKNAI